MTAALALALVAVLAGLLATAFLEPFLDEYRLATLFGVSLGMLRGTRHVHGSVEPVAGLAFGSVGLPVATEVGIVNLTIGVHSMAPAGGTELNVFQVSRGLGAARARHRPGVPARRLAGRRVPDASAEA